GVFGIMICVSFAGAVWSRGSERGHGAASKRAGARAHHTRARVRGRDVVSTSSVLHDHGGPRRRRRPGGVRTEGREDPAARARGIFTPDTVVVTRSLPALVHRELDRVAPGRDVERARGELERTARGKGDPRGVADLADPEDVVTDAGVHLRRVGANRAGRD